MIKISQFGPAATEAVDTLEDFATKFAAVMLERIK